MSGLGRLFRLRILGSNAILVVVVLGVMGVALVTLLRKKPADVERERLDADFAFIADAVARHGSAHGKPPGSLEELTRPGPKGEAPATATLPTDPWGSPYLLSRHGDEVVIRSAGADRQEGTEDDRTFSVRAGSR